MPIPAKHTSGPHDAGHDEDEEKAKIGTPLERVLLMANAMLDAIKTFKSPDGKALCIRIGTRTITAAMPLVSSLCSHDSLSQQFLTEEECQTCTALLPVSSELLKTSQTGAPSGGRFLAALLPNNSGRM